MKLKKLKAYTERNDEPVSIFLEQCCPNCCDSTFDQYSEGNRSVSVKTKYADWNPNKLDCERCKNTRAIIADNGLMLIDFVAKYLGSK